MQKAREDGDIAPDIVHEMLMIQGTPNQHLAVVHVHPAVSSRFGAKLPMMQCWRVRNYDDANHNTLGGDATSNFSNLEKTKKYLFIKLQDGDIVEPLRDAG